MTVAPSTPPWWKRLLETWLGAPLDAAQRDAFAREIGDTNYRRLRVLLPFMIVGHAIHIVLFRVGEAERTMFTESTLRWREGLVATHAATLGIAVMLAIGVLRFGRTAAGRIIGPATALTYLVHGAVIASVDQLTITSVTPFVAYCLGVGVIFCMSTRTALALYAIAEATFVVGITTMQPSESVRLATLPSGASIVVVSVILVSMLHAARRREFAQRVTIDEQRGALAQLNAGLERRVSDQVAEIVVRAEEVERLNAQLHAQVRARSTELSLALAKLAQHRDVDGTLKQGAVLGERFEIDALIGEGGMGVVYSGVDRTTHARVAIKVIQASSTQQLDALHRFLREARTAATINHPAVVRVLHVDVSDEGLLYQVQDLVDGETLQRRLRIGKRWDAGTVARFVSTLCEALAAAHERGIVHRDVKPSNVMLTKASPGLRLLDFGIAKLYEDAMTGQDATHTGVILGTPAFMAPEQVDGRNVTDRADVYAIGVIVFLLITGRYPFDEATPRAMIMSHVLVTAPDARVLEPSVPEDLAALIAQCLAKDPTARPSAADLAKTLASFADAHGAATLETMERENTLRDVEGAEAEGLKTVAVRKVVDA